MTPLVIDLLSQAGAMASGGDAVSAYVCGPYHHCVRSKEISGAALPLVDSCGCSRDKRRLAALEHGCLQTALWPARGRGCARHAGWQRCGLLLARILAFLEMAYHGAAP
jgi:hypothetical protein